MKKNSKIKLIFSSLLLLILSFGLASCGQRAVASNPQTLTGIVTDVHCFVKKPDPTLDSKKCLQMPACAATGYGLAVMQSDKTYKFYFLDGEFAPAATGTQDTVAKLIDNSTKTDHFFFTVTGTLTGETKTADGKSYPIFKVSEISESDG